jgi:hypothetical protein
VEKSLKGLSVLRASLKLREFGEKAAEIWTERRIIDATKTRCAVGLEVIMESFAEIGIRS